MSSLIPSMHYIDSRFLHLGFLLLAILGNWIDHWTYFLSLILIAAVISSLTFFHDKKWIASADKYIRVMVVQSFLKQAFYFVIFIVLGFLFVYYEDEFTWLNFISNNVLFGWTLTIGILHIGYYFQKFVDSIKTFDEEIQLPGRESEIILWKEVYTFTDVENKVTISPSKGEHEFNIDPADCRYTLAIIAD